MLDFATTAIHLGVDLTGDGINNEVELFTSVFAIAADLSLSGQGSAFPGGSHDVVFDVLPGDVNAILNPPFTITGLEGSLSINAEIVFPGAVPVPAAVWLFGSGLIGLIGVARRKAA